MFTRIVEINTRAGKARELTRLVSNKVLSILKEQPGFIDEMTLVSTDSQDRIVAISFWKTREDAERYERDHYHRVTETISNLIEGTPHVRTFDVEQSTLHKIAAGRAA